VETAVILDKQAEIEAVYERYLEPKESRPGTGAHGSPRAESNLDDVDLLDKIRGSDNGPKFKPLYDHGDTSEYATGEHDGRSEGDLALCGILAWWTDYDTNRVDTLFRQSKLYRAKWDEKHYGDGTTYGQGTIAKACKGKRPGDGYTGKASAGFAGSIPGHAENFTEDEEPWEELKDLPDLYPPVPSLPADMLPEPLQAWLADIAERTCLPLEFVACPALGGLSAVVGRTVGIHPKRRDDWLVAPNLWAGIVARPGLMKSAAISEATKPLSRLAVNAQETFQAAKLKAEVRRERITLEIAALKEDAKRSAKKGSKAHDLN
jgi:hypothetical protein